ncbi:hypothetical protein HPB48_006902 [Haemaphysalis longicornis]|uniref:Calpain catalytic domain-containing protein n=1 Tax=Haemaphysalis longicornis TaxID=44386 RepID=A0A9J6FHH4_HAELO|nr:hypothetical protein HPB48_006902 [Haemaphysalis longicornis]
MSHRREAFLVKSIYPGLLSTGAVLLFPVLFLRWLSCEAACECAAEGGGASVAGDRWLLSAISCLTSTPRFLDRVVPSDQGFGPGYCGLFRFRFWRFGEWHELLVDDRLPTHRGRLFYMHSADPSEFWAALLEKAYAKYVHCSRRSQIAPGNAARTTLVGEGAPRELPRFVGKPCGQVLCRVLLLRILIILSAPLPKGSEEYTCKHMYRFYGGYDQLQLGHTGRALQDLTGGVAQTFRMAHVDPPMAFSMVSSAVPRSTLMAACIIPDHHKAPARLNNGLYTQHAYSVTGIAKVRVKQGEVTLIRLRNPWGRGEWNGPWSDRSWEWDGLSDRDRQLLGVRQPPSEGEFWMSFDDFTLHFTHLDLVHIGPDDWMQESALHSKKPWRAVLARRRWRAGYNAGGGPAHPETTSCNPQFHVQIPKTSASKCHMVVSVTQQYVTDAIRDAGKKPALHPVGFAIYELQGSAQARAFRSVLAHRWCENTQQAGPSLLPSRVPERSTRGTQRESYFTLLLRALLGCSDCAITLCGYDTPSRNREKECGPLRKRGSYTMVSSAPLCHGLLKKWERPFRTTGCVLASLICSPPPVDLWTRFAVEPTLCGLESGSEAGLLIEQVASNGSLIAIYVLKVMTFKRETTPFGATERELTASLAAALVILQWCASSATRFPSARPSQIPANLTRLTTQFVATHRPLDVTVHTTTRETVTFFTLPAGDYIVLPCTSTPNCETRFLLRIFTDEHSNVWCVQPAYRLCCSCLLLEVLEQ